MKAEASSLHGEARLHLHRQILELCHVVKLSLQRSVAPLDFRKAMLFENDSIRRKVG